MARGSNPQRRYVFTWRVCRPLREVTNVGLPADLCGEGRDDHGIRANSDPGFGGGEDSSQRRTLRREEGCGAKTKAEFQKLTAETLHRVGRSSWKNAVLRPWFEGRGSARRRRGKMEHKENSTGTCASTWPPTRSSPLSSTSSSGRQRALPRGTPRRSQKTSARPRRGKSIWTVFSFNTSSTRKTSPCLQK
jgi:hypothetical protein